MERWEYKYDTMGNLIQELDKLTGTPGNPGDPGKFDQYSYDELNRLVSAVIQSTQYGQQLQTFAYDAFGNRTMGKTERVTHWAGNVGASAATVSPTSVPKLANLTLNATDLALKQRNQIPAVMSNNAPTGAIYDAQGNLTQMYEQPSDTVNVLTMTYDALGRITRVSHSGKGIREDYQYRADGLRTVIDDTKNGVFQKTRIQIYNDARQLVSQYEKSSSGSLTWKRDILYLGTREAAEIDIAGMHVTQVDHLGTPRVVTGPTGQLESKQKFLPSGELLDQTVGGYKTSKGYTNHEQTDESGLIYMQARMYIPLYGRFTSPDPARDQHFELTQSWNIASYVRNNPVMSTDPTGMVEEPEVDKNKGASKLPVYAQQSADGNETGAKATENKASQTGEVTPGNNVPGNYQETRGR
ncbi:MAG: RHS repeat-associated core domain-containing protein [Holophaga sp.]|nr:RHS repeat-associated core domain-containing protein [Holophaga sp.]